MRVIIGFLVALAVLTLAGIGALTWFDQASFLAATPGASLDASARLSWYLKNLQGMAGGMPPLYVVIFGAGLLIALLVAGLVVLAMPGLRTVIYAVAGGVSALAVLLIFPAVMGGIVPLPGARSAAGFWAQGGAGFLAGLVFALITPPRERRRFG